MSFNKDCSIISDFKTDKIDNFKVDVKRQEINFNAPEYLMEKKISTKYDIWCLGWYLFTICTFQNPFEILNRIEDFKKWDKLSISTLTFKTDLVNLFQK